MTQPLSEFTLYPLLPRDMRFQIFMSLFSGKGTGAPRENINNWITCNLVCKEWREILVDFPNMLTRHRDVLFKKIAREGTFGIPQYLYGNPKMIAKPQEIKHIAEKMKQSRDIDTLENVCKWFFQTREELILFVEIIKDAIPLAFLNCASQKNAEQITFFSSLMGKREMLKTIRVGIRCAQYTRREPKDYLHFYTALLDLFAREHQDEDLIALFEIGKALDHKNVFLLTLFFEMPYSVGYIEKAVCHACELGATSFLKFLFDSDLHRHNLSILFEKSKDITFLYRIPHSRTDHEGLKFLIEKSLIDPIDDPRILQGFFTMGHHTTFKWLCVTYAPSFLKDKQLCAAFFIDLCVSSKYDWVIETTLRNNWLPIDYSMLDNIILKSVIMKRVTKPFFFEELVKAVDPSYPDNEPLKIAIKGENHWAFVGLIADQRIDLGKLKGTEYEDLAKELIEKYKDLAK